MFFLRAGCSSDLLSVDPAVASKRLRFIVFVLPIIYVRHTPRCKLNRGFHFPFPTTTIYRRLLRRSFRRSFQSQRAGLMNEEVNKAEARFAQLELPLFRQPPGTSFI
jgi:hypothetical protein